METQYKAYGTNEEGVYIGVACHYLHLSDAQKAYKESLKEGISDDSIYIQIAKDNDTEAPTYVTICLKDAERIALTLLNICRFVDC